ncbi:hypothetical protein [Actinomadura flavalba]|uniref:hypothetical protein n=1 Tax=Actinomadura flavalba TaxID=1120938 RepID=UPI0012DF438F|nr:hypothetical protein [Actinomadura flavalba]
MAGVLVAALLAGAACGGGEDGGGDGPRAVVVAENADRPAQKVVFRGAERVEVQGLDAAAARRVNDAFRAPLEWAATWAAATLLPEQKAECGDRSSEIRGKVRFGLKGELVSAATAIEMAPCFEGEGGLPTVPVTVDTKTGRALTPEDVLAAKTLTAPGLAQLWQRLDGPRGDWADCELEPLRRADLFPGRRDGDPADSPAPAGLLLAPGGLELIWSTTGTDCNNFTFKAPYAKVKDLLNPSLYGRLAASGATGT